MSTTTALEEYPPHEALPIPVLGVEGILEDTRARVLRILAIGIAPFVVDPLPALELKPTHPQSTTVPLQNAA